MFKVKILLFLFLAITLFGDNFIFGKSSIIESRTIDGTTYHIAKANADIADSRTADGAPTGKKSIVYNNLLGKVAVAKKDYNNIPNSRNGKAIIYYLTKEGEESKQSHELFFKRKDISFPVYSLDRDNKNYNNIPYEHKSKAPYDGIYLPLFILFLILSNFFDNRSVNLIPIKIRLILQAIIIIVFFIGANKVINIENKECSQSVIKTIGTIKYHVLDQPYVIFKNCNGDNSRSQMNISQLKSYNEYTPIPIYYSQETQDDFVDNRGYMFTYKVFFSKEDFFEKSETLLRKKVAVFMLLVWLYFLFNHQKKLTLPSNIIHQSKYIRVDPSNSKYSQILNKIAPVEYEEEDYDTIYNIYSDKIGNIHIKRTAIFSLLIPAIITLVLLWIIVVIAPSSITSDTPFGQLEIFILTAFSIMLSVGYLTIQNIGAIQHIGIFNHIKQQYHAISYHKILPFSQIYSFTIRYKAIKREDADDNVYYEKLFILDILLDNSEVINLFAHEDKDKIIKEAKVLSSYIEKPIYDLGKWNYYELKNFYKDTLTKKSEL